MNFSNRDAASIAIQVLGLNLVFRYFQYIAMAHTNQIPVSVATWCTTTLGLLVLGVALLFSSRWLAIFMVRHKRSLSLPVDCCLVDISSIAYSVLGVYFAILATGQLITAYQMKYELPEMRHPPQWSSIIQLLIGIALFFGGKPLARVWSKINIEESQQPPAP